MRLRFASRVSTVSNRGKICRDCWQAAQAEQTFAAVLSDNIAKVCFAMRPAHGQRMVVPAGGMQHAT